MTFHYILSGLCNLTVVHILARSDEFIAKIYMEIFKDLLQYLSMNHPDLGSEK